MLRPPHYLAFAIALVVTPALVGLTRPGARQPEAPSPVPRDRQGNPLPAGAIARLGTTRLRHPSPPTAVAFSPDGRTLVTSSAYHGSSGVWLWDPATGQLRRRLTSSLPSAGSFQFTPDGKAIVRNVGGWFCLWDVRTGKEGRKVPLPGPREILDFTLSPDGTLLATHHHERPVRVWDVASGKQVGQLPREGVGEDIAWVPRTRTLAVFAHDSKRGPLLRFWDADSGITRRFAPALPLTASPGSECFAFAPDGKTMAAVGGDSELRVFDVGTFKERLPSRGRVRPPQNLLFAPDGRTLALSCQDGMVWLLDFRGGKEMRKLPPAVARHALAFSPDGGRVATGNLDGTILVWDIAPKRGGRDATGTGQQSR